MTNATKLARKSWAKVAFGAAVHNVSERVEPTPGDAPLYVGLEHMDSESLTVHRWGSPRVLEGQKLRMRKGDVLFARRNAYLKRVAIAPHDGLFSAHGMVLRAKEEVLLHDFLPFFMQSEVFMSRAIEISVGSLSPTVNWTELSRQEFCLPPIEEQRRLVRLLRASAESLERARHLRRAVATSHASLRSHVLQIGATRRPPQAESLPCGWRIAHLGEVADFLDGQRVPIKESDRASRRGQYPYYGASGVIDYVDGYLFEEPLVLLSEDGANLVDRSSPIAFEASGRFWVNNHAHVLRVKPPLENLYLVEYLEGLSLAEWLSGTAQPKLNKAAAERIPVPIPPNEHLGSITQLLSDSRTAITACEKRCAASAALLMHLTAGVFGGELSLP